MGLGITMKPAADPPGGRRRRARLLPPLLLVFSFAGVVLPAASRPAPGWPHAAVALPDPVAAAAALKILEAGGNAVDAAVAASFALAVTHPQAGNLGGGGFLLARMAGGRCFVVDYRETAPAAATREMFLDGSGRPLPALSRESWLAVGVPGAVAGMARALELGGTRAWPDLLAPAIALAEDGFPVPQGLSEAIAGHAGLLSAHPASARIFLPGGRPPGAGDVLVQKDLARAIRLLATEGARAFYEGAIAGAMAREMKENGGLITAGDMRGYRAIDRVPIRTSYRGYEVISVPPPSAGGIVLAEMLQMITPYSPADLGRGSSATIHLMSEVMKRAYADRATYLGDPSHVTIPAASLVSRGYAEALMRGYSPERATPAAEAGPGDPFRFESDSTTHFSIADSHGNVVAVTTTLNSWFGMGAVLDGYGFLLNNEMDDFSASPGAPNMYGLVGAEANAVAPGKRMLSSMTPAIIAKEGKPFMVLGSPGGGRITTMVFQVILNVIDHGMELQEALGAPRCHHQWRPDRITCEEEALIRDVREGLERRGHEVRAGRAWGNVQALLFDPVSGLIHGASDPRGYGEPLGY